MLTEAQLQQYREQGYARGDRILDDAELARLRSEIDRLISAHPADRRPENMPSLHYENAYLRELFLSEPLIAVAREILGLDVALFTSYVISSGLGYSPGSSRWTSLSARGGGRIKVIAALTEPGSIRASLHGVGLPARAPPIAQPHSCRSNMRLESCVGAADAGRGQGCVWPAPIRTDRSHPSARISL